METPRRSQKRKIQREVNNALKRIRKFSLVPLISTDCSNHLDHSNSNLNHCNSNPIPLQLVPVDIFKNAFEDIQQVPNIITNILDVNNQILVRLSYDSILQYPPIRRDGLHRLQCNRGRSLPNQYYLLYSG